MSPETQTQAVKRTWELVAKDLPAAGEALFREIFAIAPGAVDMFSFKNEPDMYNSPTFKKHALDVVKVVSVAVKMLDDIDAVVPVLKALGAKHVKYGVVDAHYDVVGQALLATLKKALGAKWTSEVEAAWTSVYGTVATTMKAGAAEVPKAAAEGEETPTQAVTRTWALVAKDLPAAGEALFREIFAIAPGAVEMFSFKDEPDMYNSPAFKKHALGVVTTVGVAVGKLDDLDSLVPVLKGLGAKHVKYGVADAHYDVVGQALLATLKSGLGDEWTSEVEAAWTSVYGTVATTMKAGAAEAAS